MTKEQCSLQPNYYGSSCDFQDLQSAVQQLTTKSDAQFEELKNEKWFHRIFNMVVCPRKNNIRMAEQITSLAQAQGILIEILVRLADQDANIAGMVMQSQSDIRALAQNSAYLQERLYLLEDKSYGIKENENLKDLNGQQRNILSGCLNEASKLYAMPSNEQRLYANELLNYLQADARVENLEDALDDLEDNTKRKILSCIITYMYLYDHTTESMEQDEQEDFIDLFDLGRKTIKSLKQQTVDTYRLRGVDGCIDRYITAPIEITEETPFEVELPEPKAAEGASEAQAEENGEEAIDTNTPREKLVLSGSIQNDGETVYKNKDIHFSSAIMNCKGTVKFINCTIHYNEDSGSHIYLNNETELSIMASTIICHGDCKKGNYFIQGINRAWAKNCTIKNCIFIDCVGFIGCGCITFCFDNNKVQGTCSEFFSFGVKEEAKISNNHFVLPDKPTFEFRDANDAIATNFIYCGGKNVFIENNIFECEKSINASSYMVENNIRVIKGSAWIGYDEETDKGTVSNCTFVRMNKCIEHIGTVKDCIFEKCSEAIIECGFLITENRFAECKNAIVNLCSRATLSNCQFIDCAGKELVTSRWNSQVTIHDCEFSNISLSPVNSVEEIEQIGELCLKNYIRELIPGKFSTLNTKGVLIEIGGVDKKFANSNRPSKIERCIFNGVHICSEGGFACNMGKWKACKADRNLTKDQMNFLISVYTANYDKFNYPRVIVSDCTFKNCASVHQEIINTEPYDSVFGSRHNYTAISVRNNYGLDNIGDPTSYVKSSDVKLKEIDANGNKIGSSLSVN